MKKETIINSKKIGQLCIYNEGEGLQERIKSLYSIEENELIMFQIEKSRNSNKSCNSEIRVEKQRPKPATRHESGFL